MTEADVEVAIQKARKKYRGCNTSDYLGQRTQFIAKDFKEFIWVVGMMHVRTSTYYPQSNGKIERWHHTLKSEYTRPGVLLSLADARTVFGRYIENYNTVRLNCAIGYNAPRARLEGKDKQIFEERDRKPQTAREARKAKRRHLGLVERS